MVCFVQTKQIFQLPVTQYSLFTSTVLFARKRRSSKKNQKASRRFLSAWISMSTVELQRAPRATANSIQKQNIWDQRRTDNNIYCLLLQVHVSALVNNPACDGSRAVCTYKCYHLQLFALWSRLMHIKSHYLSLAKPPSRFDMMNVQFPLSPHSQLITISINKVCRTSGVDKKSHSLSQHLSVWPSWAKSGLIQCSCGGDQVRRSEKLYLDETRNYLRVCVDFI